MTNEVFEPFPWRYCPACGEATAPAHDGERDRPYCKACKRFYYHNPTPATCCFVARTDGALLFAQRAVPPHVGAWALPGGYMELGETAEEAALRELREETNIHASRAHLIGASTRQGTETGAILVLGYVVEGWSGEETMRPDTDAMALRFYAREDRPEVPFSVHRELIALYDSLDLRAGAVITG